MTMGDFPSSLVFLDLFLQWFIVLLIEVSDILKFIPRYLIFWGYCEWNYCSIFFLISFIVDRKATDFYKLILYPATLLKLYMVSRSFWIDFFGLWVIGSFHLQIEILWLFLYLFVFLLFFLLALLLWLGIPMLNRSGESGHPCLIPNFGRNYFSCSPISMMLAIGLSYIYPF
jgi:hypothetical protein